MSPFVGIIQQYEKYMAANDVSKGGSFYLQSKVYRAKEQLDEYLAETKKEAKTEETSSSSGTSDAHESSKQ